MRAIVVLAIFVALAGCDHSEQDARRALTVAQGAQNEGRVFVALESFESLGKKWPQTAAATDAMNAARPLRQQLTAAKAACDAYGLDTAAVPKDLADFFQKPAGADNWHGPYGAPGEFGPFGRWAIATSCGLDPTHWPDNDKFTGLLPFGM